MMLNSIDIDNKGCGTFYGPLAQPFLYGELRKELERLCAAERGQTRGESQWHI